MEHLGFQPPTWYLTLVICLFLSYVNTEFGEPVVVHVDASITNPTVINPNRLAVGIEFLNHEIYGGLYSQMIIGESFEEYESKPFTELQTALTSNSEAKYGYVGCGGRFADDVAGLRNVSLLWHLGKAPTVQVTPELIFRGGAFHGVQFQRLTYSSGTGTVQLENYGVNCQAGLSFEHNRDYEGVVYVRTTTPMNISVCIQREAAILDYRNIAPCNDFNGLNTDNKWIPLQLKFVPTDATTCALQAGELWQCTGRFVVQVHTAGVFDVDYVFLQPGAWDRLRNAQGTVLPVRAHVMRALQAEGVKVIRMGGSMVNFDGYRWKYFRGNPVERQPYHGVWYDKAGRTSQSRGFGMFEMIDAANAVGMETILTINNQEWPQDIADFVEYCWGDQHTKWGAIRIHVDQHPDPYNVTWLEIGNEQPLDATFIKSTMAIIHAVEAKSQQLNSEKFRYCIGHNLEDDDFIIHAALLKQMLNSTNFLGDRIFWDVHLGAGFLKGDAEKFETLILDFKLQARAQHSKIRIAVLEENGYNSAGLNRAAGHSMYNLVSLRHPDMVYIHGYANGLQFWQGMDAEDAWNQGQLFITSNSTFPGAVWFTYLMDSQNYLPFSISANATWDIDWPPQVAATASYDHKTIQLSIANTDIVTPPWDIQIALHGITSEPTSVQMIAIHDFNSSPETGDINTPERPNLISMTQTSLFFNSSSVYTINQLAYNIFRFRLID